MELLERRAQLTVLEEALQGAAAGHGCVDLIEGDAGSGKTSLVRQFCSDAGARKVFWGMCEDLSTPRPLGPVREIAAQAAVGPVGTSGSDLLDALVRGLSAGTGPVLVVIEDAHWADAATVDAVRFLGRRVNLMPVVLMVTYRGYDVPADHPLQSAFGALSSDDIRRVELLPLSRAAVATLARCEDVDELYHLTGGNPFYLCEVLAPPTAMVSPTVQDTVLARVARLTDRGRACVETVAVIPGRTELWALDECEVADGLDEAVLRGILQADAGYASFTHEIARRVVDQSLPPMRRRELNRLVLKTLAAHSAEPARLSHHAAESGEAVAVAVHARAAARHAAQLGAHREAAAHYRQALEWSGSYAADEQAAFWFDYARECYLLEQHDCADEALRRAIGLHNDLKDEAAVGADLSLLSDVAWFRGRGEDAAVAASSAITVLERLPAGEALAAAYAQKAKLALVDNCHGEAVAWGEKAVDVARPLGSTEWLVHALNTIGMARWMVPPYDNRAVLGSLRLALENGLTTQVVTSTKASCSVGHTTCSRP